MLNADAHGTHIHEVDISTPLESCWSDSGGFMVGVDTTGDDLIDTWYLIYKYWDIDHPATLHVEEIDQQFYEHRCIINKDSNINQ